MANASEVQWSNIPQTNFGDALQMFRSGADYYTKAASGLKDTFDTAAQAVRNQNQAQIQQYIDQQSMGDLLNNKQAINEHIAGMMQAGGNVYDPTVMNAYLNARPDALAKQQETANALTINNAKTANTVRENNAQLAAMIKFSGASPEQQQADIDKIYPTGKTALDMYANNLAGNNATVQVANSNTDVLAANKRSGDLAGGMAATAISGVTPFERDPKTGAILDTPENKKRQQLIDFIGKSYPQANNPYALGVIAKQGKAEQQADTTFQDTHQGILAKTAATIAATTGQGIDNDIKRQTGLKEAEAKIYSLTANGDAAIINANKNASDNKANPITLAGSKSALEAAGISDTTAIDPNTGIVDGQKLLLNLIDQSNKATQVQDKETKYVDSKGNPTSFQDHLSQFSKGDDRFASDAQKQAILNNINKIQGITDGEKIRLYEAGANGDFDAYQRSSDLLGKPVSWLSNRVQSSGDIQQRMNTTLSNLRVKAREDAIEKSATKIGNALAVLDRTGNMTAETALRQNALAIYNSPLYKQLPTSQQTIVASELLKGKKENKQTLFNNNNKLSMTGNKNAPEMDAFSQAVRNVGAGYSW